MIQSTRIFWMGFLLVWIVGIQTAFADNGKIILVSVTQSSTDVAKKIDKKRVKDNVTEIASITNRTTEIFELDRFDTNIKSTIDNIVSTDDDILIFYYGGHGMSSEDGVFPSFNGREQEFPEATIHSWLKNKPHQLVLTIYDTCNQSRPRRRNNNNNRSRSKPSETLDIALVNLLFNESKGDMIMCSSKHSYYSWSDDYKGGFFTFALFKTMKAFPTDETTNTSNIWEAFADSVQSLTNQLCLNSHCQQQYPQYQSSVTTTQPNQHIMPDYFYTPRSMGWYDIIKYAKSEFNQEVTLEELLQWNDRPYAYTFKKNELVWLAPNF